MKLLVKKNAKEYQESSAYAKIFPVGRDEVATAGQRGYKASMKAEIWAFEYDGQPELEIEGKRLVIYRTYGPKIDGKIELYAGERAGKG